jgi:hypothetical protein
MRVTSAVRRRRIRVVWFGVFSRFVAFGTNVRFVGIVCFVGIVAFGTNVRIVRFVGIVTFVRFVAFVRIVCPACAGQGIGDYDRLPKITGFLRFIGKKHYI